MAVSNTDGYWLVAADGGLFSFGAPFYGTASGHALAGVAQLSHNSGYEEVDINGGIHSFPGPVTVGAVPVGAVPVGAVPVGAVPVKPAVAIFPLSFFDRSVAAQPVAPASLGLVENVVNQYTTYYGSIGVNRMPVFSVPATQPLVPVTVKTNCTDFTKQLGTSVPIPLGAYTTNPSYQGDSSMVVYQPSTHTVWELWQAANSGHGTWSACWGGKIDTSTSTGVFPSPFGLSATGISYLATTITEADVASGSIQHAIAIDLVRCNYYSAPAVRGDCGSDPGEPPEGTWFRMAANVPMPASLTPFGNLVFRALQTYGAVVTDEAGAVMIEAETSTDWTFSGHTGVDPITASFAGAPQYKVLAGMPWSSLQVIQPPST
jgi:hypothetical protein